MGDSPPERAPAPPSRRRGLVRRLLASLLGTVALLLLVEGAAAVLLAWLDAGDVPGLAEEVHCQHDPLLGWRNQRDRRFADLYGPGRDLTTDSRGFRGREEIADAIPPGRYRVLCLGDSFTLGYGVGDASTWPAQLAALAPAIQAANLGQGGYGIDQCYLAYRRDAAEIAADLVVLAFIAPDFERILEARFQGEYAKPLLRLAGGSLVLPEDPLPDDWSRGETGRRFSRTFTGLRLAELLDRIARRRHPGPRLALDAAGRPLYAALGEAILRDLARLARERGHDLALVHLPLLDRRAGSPSTLLAWLGPLAAELGVPLVDLTADFDALPPGEIDSYYLPDGHPNVHGHRLIAATVRRRLQAIFPELP
ncbi:MAG: SGNH/GDSL hydrolase family protein [Planctomycetota bacterium]